MTRTIITVCAVWMALILVVVLSISHTAQEKAAADMLLGLALIWIVVCGSIMVKFRTRITYAVHAVRLGWRTKFLFFCIALALLEEFIAITLNNLAPALGAPAGAYLTATTNFVELVLFHSVIVFVPMFLAWMWLLGRYRFSPSDVFVLFGISGVIGELFLSPDALPGAGFWIFVYGLMIFAPAYSIPDERKAARPMFSHYLLALVLPTIFAFPVALIVNTLHP